MALTEAQRAALRATATAPGEMLAPRGIHFYTSFIGGQCIRMRTVKFLVKAGLMFMAGACAALTLEGKSLALDDIAMRQAAAENARERVTRSRESRTAAMMRKRGGKAVRLPYADN